MKSKTGTSRPPMIVQDGISFTFTPPQAAATLDIQAQGEADALEGSRINAGRFHLDADRRPDADGETIERFSQLILAEDGELYEAAYLPMPHRKDGFGGEAIYRRASREEAARFLTRNNALLRAVFG